MPGSHVDYDTMPKVASPPPPKKTYLSSCSINGGPESTYTFQLDPSMDVESASGKKKAHQTILYQANASMDSSIDCSHMTHVQTPGSEQWWLERRMSRSCAPSYDANNVTEYVRYRCKYMGSGVDDEGKRVRANPWQEWDGRMAVCNGFDQTGLQISDQVMKDVRDIAYYRAGGQEAGLNKEDFVCQVESLPIVQ